MPAPTHLASLESIPTANSSVDIPVAAAMDIQRLEAIEQKLQAKEIVVYFDFNQSATTLTEAQKQVLDDVKFYIEQKPDAQIKVEGHTDSKGSVHYNQLLSESRAQFMSEYLAGLGADATKIKAFGKGETAPFESNKSESGRAANRRVIISLS
jgi:outer membrane protein OmpA-like peptidoglycan-associated protein